MSDMIDRWAAIGLIHSLYPSAPIMRINRKRWKEKYKPYIEIEKALKQLPSAQPDIIRCKDCKWSDWYYSDDGNIYYYCMETGATGRTADDYCSYTEKENR